MLYEHKDKITNQLSGGMKRKLSLAMAIVSQPKLLILDEPTSGLDSVQAYELAKLLKKESLRGLSILCTIHTPSAETFLQFDRCILLSEGYTIYNGPPILIREYFEEKGFIFEKFQNLADWLLKLALETKNLNPD